MSIAISKTITNAQEARMAEFFRDRIDATNAERAAQDPPLAPLTDNQWLTTHINNVIDNLFLGLIKELRLRQAEKVRAVFDTLTDAQRANILTEAGVS